LLPALEQLCFAIAAYGCAVCAGNSGPLEPAVDDAIANADLVCAAVLSGNRNFEARIHPSLRSNFLMSPPLVVAYAIAGTVRLDLTRQPLGHGQDGRPVYLADIWPSRSEVEAALVHAVNPAAYSKAYRDVSNGGELWEGIDSPRGATFDWRNSTYVAEPPIFDGFSARPPRQRPMEDARILAILGDSITTDHISPAGRIDPASPAGEWLLRRNIPPSEFNTYGARRGQHEVMIRGTFANVRLRNSMTPEVEGGVTRLDGQSDIVSIFDAAESYRARGTPLVVIAGNEYGCGSSRDWAAKGTALLGVRAVIARSFERIHRSNLIGMGVLPCQFMEAGSAQTLNLDGTETIAIEGLDDPVLPRSQARLVAVKPDGTRVTAPLLVRIDSAMEAEYFRHGGMPHYMLRKILFGVDSGAAGNPAQEA
jgi:aconitate hydratase A / 2-methylisocitrate dehydratase